MKAPIYLYQDEGVSQESLRHLQRLVKEMTPTYPCETISAQEIRAGQLDGAHLLVIPGGADRFFHKKLTGAGNQKIRLFVEGGGSYLGICAGAYYGAQYVEFAKGCQKLEVCAERELAFFKGVALGPYLKPYVYDSNYGASAVKVQNFEEKKSSFYAYLNGGCYFVGEEGDRGESQPIAYYGDDFDQKTAILSVTVKKGRAILSGVHFEYSPQYMDGNDPYLAPLLLKLLETDADRMQCARRIFTKLGMTGA